MIESLLTGGQKIFCQTFREFGRREIEPHLKEYAGKKEYPAELAAKFAEIGVMGLTIAEAYGGGGRRHARVTEMWGQSPHFSLPWGSFTIS